MATYHGECPGCGATFEIEDDDDLLQEHEDTHNEVTEPLPLRNDLIRFMALAFNVVAKSVAVLTEDAAQMAIHRGLWKREKRKEPQKQKSQSSFQGIVQ